MVLIEWFFTIEIKIPFGVDSKAEILSSLVVKFGFSITNDEPDSL